MNRDGVKEEIKRRASADFLNLFDEAGGRRRGRALHCLFHKDKTPSASIHKGRFHCFGCGLSLDVIEFVMRTQGLEFRAALEYLGDRFGVQIISAAATPEDRARWAEERREFERDLPSARLWKRAAEALCEEALAMIKAGFFDPTLPEPDTFELQAITRFQMSLQRTGNTAMVATFREWSGHNPGLTHFMVLAARKREAVEGRALLSYLRLVDREKGRVA